MILLICQDRTEGKYTVIVCEQAYCTNLPISSERDTTWAIGQLTRAINTVPASAQVNHSLITIDVASQRPQSQAVTLVTAVQTSTSESSSRAWSET